MSYRPPNADYWEAIAARDSRAMRIAHNEMRQGFLEAAARFRKCAQSQQARGDIYTSQYFERLADYHRDVGLMLPIERLRKGADGWLCYWDDRAATASCELPSDRPLQH